MVANIHQGEALRQVLGIDQVRVRIMGELASLQLEIDDAPQDDLLVQMIALWINNFSKSLRHPDPQAVINAYVPELVNILRPPLGPFPVELFGEQPIPLIRCIVQKLRDSDSLLYSEAFHQEAQQILAAIPPLDGRAALIKQLRKIEAIMGHQFQRQAVAVNEVRQAVFGQVEQREAQLQERIDRLARCHFAEGQRIAGEIHNLGMQDQELRAKLMDEADRLKRKADELNAGADCLQAELDANRGKIGELERENRQLQIDIDRTRAQIESKKSGWLTQALCIAASVALSYICKTKIVILPPT
jgi:hypothetical protein